MRLLAEAARAAGNVLLRPAELTGMGDVERWRRAVVAGSRDQRTVSRIAEDLRAVAPGITVEAFFSGSDGRWDVAVLALTGEGYRREKARALVCGAPVILAYGAGGRWYRVALPPAHPTRAGWWARLWLALTLAGLYHAVTTTIVVFQILRMLAPREGGGDGPGAPAGRTVTFIVPNYNQRHLMDFCLPPLLAEAGNDHRVLVVDDASTDDTVAYLGANYPGVRVVALGRNQGFGGAVRAGIRASDTPLFALINTDVQVRRGWLAAILPHFDHPDTFAVCSRIDLPGGSQMETGNVAAAWSGILEPHHLPPTLPGPILYAGGASSVYDRSKYEALGGFETIYRPMYFEDIELGYRAWRRGWRSLFEPRASVFHQRRAWIGTRFSEAGANETFLRNGLLFVWKNVRDPMMLAQNCAYVCSRLVCELLAGEGTMARAFLRALPQFGRMLMKRWHDYRRGDLSDRQVLRLSQPTPADPAESGGR